MAFQKSILVGFALFGSQASAAVARPVHEVAPHTPVVGAETSSLLVGKQPPLDGFEMPISDRSINDFIKKVSSHCGNHYKYMLTGKDSETISYKNFGMKDATDAASCEKAKGVQCDEKSFQLVQQIGEGGKVKKEDNATKEQKTCIPKDCLLDQGEDLKMIADWISTQYGPAMTTPGTVTTSLTMTFDCSKVGGKKVTSKSAAQATSLAATALLVVFLSLTA
eukprot:TRINITY_DN9743_c0_g1_i2.p1 TRINITY_DN9743_c0_g1~~TRINITY_DN9743_c0_g1_i2.p1  ORF type:complete len:222 (+),score=42.18 TRINITY_DN9743_c0_g1_i2:89-754(+)